MEDLYFPTTCVVSLLYTMTDDATAELVWLVTMASLASPSLWVAAPGPNRAVVQFAGDAFSVQARSSRKSLELGGPCQILLLRYTQALITKISQTAVCNRLHTPAEQRFCRWLLRIHDRVESTELRITHEFHCQDAGGTSRGCHPGCGTPAGRPG